MSLPSGFGFGNSAPLPEISRPQEVLVQRQLSRIMAFLGLTIDQVCNDPIAKGRVACYYRLARNLERYDEVQELEAQWTGPDSYHRG